MTPEEYLATVPEGLILYPVGVCHQGGIAHELQKEIDKEIIDALVKTAGRASKTESGLVDIYGNALTLPEPEIEDFDEKEEYRIFHHDPIGKAFFVWNKKMNQCKEYGEPDFYNNYKIDIVPSRNRHRVRKCAYAFICRMKNPTNVGLAHVSGFPNRIRPVRFPEKEGGRFIVHHGPMHAGRDAILTEDSFRGVYVIIHPPEDIESIFLVDKEQA